MFVRNNPVLHRELMINLRTDRSFLMLLLFQMVLAGVIYFAWPMETRLDLSEKSQANRELVDFFFLGQFVIAALLAPSFAAGSICGEKERLTYEMLLASPLSTFAVTWGKWMASVTHLLLMMVASLPIVMLCMPLGGVSPLEVMGGYFGMTVCLLVFSMISLTCSSIFSRTSSALVTSYIVILPLLLLAAAFWFGFRNLATFRLQFVLGVLPVLAIPFCVGLFHFVANRMLYPPDIGSEGKEVLDQEIEKQEVVGLYIDRNAWPDRWFAPAKRTTLMEDHINPVYDKEMRSEILSQGTLMMRVLIQVGFVLSVFLLPTLYFATEFAFIFPCYIVLFYILLWPVFSAGAITSERERQTLDLLLTTTLCPWTIVLGKMLAGFRVSTVLTLLMAWPLVLGIVLNFQQFYLVLPSVGGFVILILLTCVSTTILGMFCSSVCRKTSHAIVLTYSLILLLYFSPPAMEIFFRFFLPSSTTPWAVEFASLFSPFSAAARLPAINNHLNQLTIPGRGPIMATEMLGYYWHFGGYVLVTIVGLGLVTGVLIARFNRRWLVSFGEG
jgi:ABC-type transport system involved in multi-copper enzyme maturation permease subunit